MRISHKEALYIGYVKEKGFFVSYGGVVGIRVVYGLCLELDETRVLF